MSQGLRKTYVIDLDINAVAYASGDALGTVQTLPDAMLQSNQSGEIEELCVFSQDGIANPVDFLIFESVPTTVANNAPYTLSASDTNKLLGVIRVAAGDYVSFASRAVATKEVNLAFQAQQSTSLYVQAILPSGTPTYASGALRVKITLRQG